MIIKNEPKESPDMRRIRQYLLGNVEHEIDAEQIEERLIGDEEFLNQFLIGEEELVQDYADGNLTAADRHAFEKNYLISAERRERVAFARALRKYIDEESAKEKLKKKAGGGWSETFLWRMRRLFSSPVPVAAFGIAVIFICSLLIWFSYFRASEAELAIMSLNRAYQNERPLESRLTGFDHAPFGRTRGGEESINFTERNRAERTLLDAAAENPTAENFHSLGRLYLAKKQFEAAIKELEKARQAAPQNAEILSDLGVGYLEKSKTLAQEEDGKRLELAALALEHFEQSLKIEPDLPAARFNLAKTLEVLNLPNEARQAWQRYLELDSTSPWADEARGSLQSFESEKEQDVSAAELERLFLEAFFRRDDEKAFRLAGQNRELIKEKYLPQRLALEFVFAGAAEREEKLRALIYLGRQEKERIGDSYATDLANYYVRVTDEHLPFLREAQLAVRNGYRLCLKNDFSGALAEFSRARDLFLSAGNTFEADTVCRHFIAYCLYNLDRKRESHPLFEQVDDFCRAKQYQWLGILNFYWLLGSQVSLGYKTSTQARTDYQRGLGQAEEMNDLYMKQKFLLLLVRKSYFVRQKSETLAYLEKLFELSRQPNISARQKFRNYDKAIEILAAHGYGSLAKHVVRESVTLSEAMTDPLFVTGSQINAGIVYTHTGDYDEAREWLEKARKNAEQVTEDAQRQIELAKIFLREGHLETKKADYARAAQLYDDSVRRLEAMNTPVALYEARKSRLAAYQKLNADAEVEKDIAATLRMAEKYRREISDERERHSFFDGEQAVYDIAVEHALRQNRPDEAFNYAESAVSRSLLDWLLKGARTVTDREGSAIIFADSATNLRLDEIRERLPSEVQILQFTILEDKLLLWLVTRDEFRVFSTSVKSIELREKVENYLQLIRTGKTEKQTAAVETAARELYRLLVEPAVPYLDKNKKICVIPSQALFQLPFAALLADDGRYFIEDFGFFYAPSASVFILSTENAGSKSALKDENIFILGDPAFDPEKFPDLPGLPEAQREAESVAGNYGEALVLTGKEATKRAFLESYRNFDVIHFAGHYLVEPDSPLFSKLVLAKSGENESDGFLTNFDLLGGSPGKTRLVVLSACQTGIEGYYNGEGLTGLSRTFLSLGVPLVVASLWQVDSAATDRLMQRFHYYRRGNLSTSDALRRAQLDLMHDPSQQYGSAYFWAAFAVYGGYAEF